MCVTFIFMICRLMTVINNNWWGLTYIYLLLWSKFNLACDCNHTFTIVLDTCASLTGKSTHQKIQSGRALSSKSLDSHSTLLVSCLTGVKTRSSIASAYQLSLLYKNNSLGSLSVISHPSVTDQAVSTNQSPFVWNWQATHKWYC